MDGNLTVQTNPGGGVSRRSAQLLGCRPVIYRVSGVKAVLVAVAALTALAWSPGMAAAASLPSGPSTAIALPADGWSAPRAQGDLQVFELAALACPETGSCVAVGNYLDAAGIRKAMVVTESGNR